MGYIHGLVHQLFMGHHLANQADALCLGTVQKFTGQKIVLGLGHADEHGPDHCGVVTRRHSQPNVAVGKTSLLRCYGDVSQ